MIADLEWLQTPVDFRPRLKAVRADLAAGVPVDTLLMECFAQRTSEVVIAQAQTWKADLIVLGTHGRRGVGRLLMGSDAEQIVRSATVPVLLVRAEEVAASTPVDGAAHPAETPAKEFATSTV